MNADNVEYSSLAINGPSSRAEDEDWIIDSSATTHVCCNWDLFDELNEFYGGRLNGIGGSHEIQGAGTVQMGRWLLQNVAFVPTMNFNLFSVSSFIRDSGFKVCFSEQNVSIIDMNNKLFNIANLIENDLFIHFGSKRKQIYANQEKHHHNKIKNSSLPKQIMPGLNVETAITMHARLGHPSFETYNKLAPLIQSPKFNPKSVDNCPTCSNCKSTSSKTQYVRPLQMIEVSLSPQYKYVQCLEHQYYLLIRDAYSRYYHVLNLRKKEDASVELISWIKRVEEYFHSKGYHYCVEKIRSNNSNTFVNNITKTFFYREAIIHETYDINDILQNVTMARAHSNICEKARCLMSTAYAPPKLWSMAISCALYIINRLPLSNKSLTIPWYLWNGVPITETSSLEYYKTFGCFVSVKNDGRIIKGIFVGYNIESKAYRVYNLATFEVGAYSPHLVRFDENSFPFKRPDGSLLVYEPDFSMFNK